MDRSSHPPPPSRAPVAARAMAAVVRRHLHDLRARAGRLVATIAATWIGGRRADEASIEMEALSEEELCDVYK